MAQASNPPAPAPALGRDALRVVLFGMPDAGKSSLLGALSQAAGSQEHLLSGQLTDLSQGLAELRRQLYEHQPKETLQEVVPYPVRFEPLSAESGETPPRLEATLYDCDGRVANELLGRRRPLDPGAGLAGAVLNADVLLLVVDASASAAQMDADFGEFVRFLRLLEHSRGRRSDVGGLPVELVLTKCDLLARPGDTFDAWQGRIAERKRQVQERFQSFVDRQELGPTPFGRIELDVEATAVKRPVLADTPAQPREPLGVAELFRDALADAQAFRVRQARAGRRLFWTVAGTGGLIAAMLGLVGHQAFNRQQEDPATRMLLTKLSSYRAREPQTPSLRLRDLRNRIDELTDLHNDPSFARLPDDERAYVDTRLAELRAYETFRDELTRIPAPARVRTERQLNDAEAALQKLAPPAEYQAQWGQTEAVQARAQRLQDLKALRAAVTELTDWYQGLTRRGQELLTFADRPGGGPVPWPDWHGRVRSLLAEADAPPHRPDDPLPQSALTYDAAYRFDRVAAARDEWEAVKKRLLRLKDISAALGLGGPQAGPAPLDLTAALAAGTAEQAAAFAGGPAAAAVRELEGVYPRYKEEFTIAGLPETVSGEIRQAALLRYDQAIRAGREVVLRHLRDASPGEAETPEGWRALRPWLAAPDDLQAWRVLATTLARLHNADAGDPVAALDAFVRQDMFELTLRELTFDVPDDANVRPAGTLAVHHRVGTATNRHAFELTGDERRDERRRATRYRFRTSGNGATTFTYRPGEILWADLPVRVGDSSDFLLTWARNRSLVFQFERLVRPPRLHRKDQENTQGENKEGIALEVIPENGVPRLPDLVPVVPIRFEKR